MQARRPSQDRSPRLRRVVGLVMLAGTGCAEALVPDAPHGADPSAADLAGGTGAMDHAPKSFGWGGESIAESLPASAVERLRRHDATAASTDGPEIVYPLSGSVHPVNFGGMVVEWRVRNPDHRVFRVRIDNARGHFDSYVGCEGPHCTLALADEVWRGLGEANAGRGVAITIAATGLLDDRVVDSTPVTASFTGTALGGGLYYWSTASQGLWRLPLGAAKAEPFVAPDSDGNPTACAGCHSVSRNGRVFSFTATGGSGALQVGPTGDPSRRLFAPAERADASTSALSPSGDRVAVSHDAALFVRDTGTGAEISRLGPEALGGKGAFFPEWSPDGRQIAMTVAAVGNRHGGEGPSDFDLAGGEIAVVPFVDGAFGAVRVVVAQGADFNYYPSFSPDGRYLVFVSAPVGQPGGSVPEGPATSTYANQNGRLRLVSLASGRIWDLGRASGGTGSGPSWPKFTPFEQDGGALMFVAYSSVRDVGFRLENSAEPFGFERRPQLWLAAIDAAQLRADEAAPGESAPASPADPSRPPVWMPFQDIEARNHLPYFTEVVACGTTAGGTCGAGELCVDGACVVP